MEKEKMQNEFSNYLNQGKLEEFKKIRMISEGAINSNISFQLFYLLGQRTEAARFLVRHPDDINAQGVYEYTQDQIRKLLIL